MAKEYLNPEALFPSQPAGFSQLVTARGGKTVYLSGQTAWDAEREIVGGANILEQMRQALRNIELAMRAAGGSLADVVSLRIYIVNYKRDDAEAISKALHEFFPAQALPASTWIGVVALAVDAFLIEIEAIGV